MTLSQSITNRIIADYPWTTASDLKKFQKWCRFDGDEVLSLVDIYFNALRKTRFKQPTELEIIINNN